MDGANLLIRTLSVPLPKGNKDPQPWQYHSRSDHHSKVACWGIVFDFMQHCPLLRKHAYDGKVGFGINHRMIDFKNNKSKNLDLVICTMGSESTSKEQKSLVSMARQQEILLSTAERAKLDRMPPLNVVDVGSVLVALEAKACMTEHTKAKPRLHDELNSSHLIVHGAADSAISAGFAMINISERFVSPGKNPKPRSGPVVWNKHHQPSAAEHVVKMIADIPRRTKPGEVGYDAMAILIIECLNDDVTPIKLEQKPPAPQVGSSFHYESMIHRLSNLYSTRFSAL